MQAMECPTTQEARDELEVFGKHLDEKAEMLINHDMLTPFPFEHLDAEMIRDLWEAHAPISYKAWLASIVQRNYSDHTGTEREPHIKKVMQKASILFTQCLRLRSQNLGSKFALLMAISRETLKLPDEKHQQERELGAGQDRTLAVSQLDKIMVNYSTARNEHMTENPDHILLAFVDNSQVLGWEGLMRVVRQLCFSINEYPWNHPHSLVRQTKLNEQLIQTKQTKSRLVHM